MNEEKNFKGVLDLELNIGYNVNGEYTRSVSLLKSNGVAEEVFSKKTSDKPYTWIANCLTIAVKSIGSVDVGVEARQNYLKDNVVNIPKVIKDMPMADANSLLLEIHRRTWKNLVEKQEIMCKYCAKTAIADVDLDRIDLTDDDKNLIAGSPKFEFIICDLVDGCDLTPIIVKLKKENELGHLKDINFNRFIYRVPTLGDALRNEKYASDNINFWRRIASDCLVSIQEVDNGRTVNEFPEDFFAALGLDLYKQYLSTEDLGKVRYALREELPTMPFSYTDTCPCDLQKEIPFVMEASSFFSV